MNYKKIFDLFDVCDDKTQKLITSSIKRDNIDKCYNILNIFFKNINFMCIDPNIESRFELWDFLRMCDNQSIEEITKKIYQVNYIWDHTNKIKCDIDDVCRLINLLIKKQFNEPQINKIIYLLNSMNEYTIQNITNFFEYIPHDIANDDLIKSIMSFYNKNNKKHTENEVVIILNKYLMKKPT